MWNLLSGIAVIVLMILGVCCGFLRVVKNYKKGILLYKIQMAQQNSSTSLTSRITPSRNRQRIVTIPRIEITEPAEDVMETIEVFNRYLERPPSYEDLDPPPYDVAVQM
nr:uncharacterized protein LOC107443389 [Parasteatoda tepidariorum]